MATVPLQDAYNVIYLQYENASTLPDDHPTNDGLLNWADVTGGAGLAASATMTVEVYFTALADTTSLPAQLVCGNSGQTCNVARIDTVTVDPPGPTGITPVPVDLEDGDDVTISNPTAILTSKRSVTETSEGMLVEWCTDSEINIVGFHVAHRSSSGEMVWVNNEMIPARYPDEVRGDCYSYLHATDQVLTRFIKNASDYALDVIMSDKRVIRSDFNLQQTQQQTRSFFLPLIMK